MPRTLISILRTQHPTTVKADRQSISLTKTIWVQMIAWTVTMIIKMAKMFWMKMI